MLDTTTRRRIDTARDILVGKVPDPKTQVEQITFAMIYKFMDDMDQLSVSLGGKSSFFTNGYEQYAWSKLMDRKLGGAARMDLYVRALEGMSTNPHIPQLFRDIFKGAFMPYRDAETLNLFLKEMNGFTYAHSEDLGDAYEYLLSIFASQGKAGQFRTPRHIIDFIVDCVNPGKHDTVLDPACGTAGFLISAYKHIIEQNKETPLSGEEKGCLTANFVGYDISPDMVRLSRVNMYLHQFANPTIHEYDTLTYEDRWDETFDVILANPPFMTPKGGIRPHTRFAVQANRSEVLFVDYIAEHLNPSGRAGVIVPEGIIFQSANAYKALRKMLVDGNYLYAVISLPAGIFQPYSGVKTSVLLLDKDLAKRTDKVLFVNVKADGYDLGAQRREIERNDLPEALRIVKAFKVDPTAEPPNPLMAQVVSKSRLGVDGDYNLSGERYRATKVVNQKWPMEKLGDIAEYINGFPFKPEDWHDNGIEIIRIQNLTGSGSSINRTLRSNIPEKYLVRKGDLLISWSATIGFYIWNRDTAYLNQHIFKVLPNEKVLLKYLYYLGNKITDLITGKVHGNTMQHITRGLFDEIEIPLPPFDVQQAIVDEIDGYQKIIDGARQVVDNYKPVIKIDPAWPLVQLGEVCEVKGGKRIPKGMTFSPHKTQHPYIRVVDIRDNTVSLENLKYIDEEVFKHISRYTISTEDVFISIAGTIGLVGTIPEVLNGANLTENAAKLVINDKNTINKNYLVSCLASINIQEQIKKLTHAVGVPKLSLERIKSIKIPIPPIDTQRLVVKSLEQEKFFITGNKALIALFESKIVKAIESIMD
jgi:type I restriction enzyme M protein